MTLSSLVRRYLLQRNDNLCSHRTCKQNSLAVLLTSHPKMGTMECSKAIRSVTKCLRVVQSTVQQWRAHGLSQVFWHIPVSEHLRPTWLSRKTQKITQRACCGAFLRKKQNNRNSTFSSTI